LGYIQVEVSYKDKQFLGDLYVVPDFGSAIIGRRWIRVLKIDIHNIESINNLFTLNNIEPSLQDILNEFKDVFEPKVGSIPEYHTSLLMKPDTKPVFIKPRRVPYALMDAVNNELDVLEKEGIIEKMDHSEWGTPLVVIPKIMEN
jgi:hypothetical protein